MGLRLCNAVSLSARRIIDHTSISYIINDGNDNGSYHADAAANEHHNADDVYDLKMLVLPRMMAMKRITMMMRMMILLMIQIMMLMLLLMNMMMTRLAFHATY